MPSVRYLLFVRSVIALSAALAIGPGSRTVCSNATGVNQGSYYTFWHDTGSGCMTLKGAAGYSVRWQLGEQGNLVAGIGWAKGSPDRTVRYTAHSFHPGTNGYLTLYGWSTDPLVEYYVVDAWGDFTPPGVGATALGTLVSDGGTYRVFRTQRTEQPSIIGTATFYQYWSVRTTKRRIGGENTITFRNHVAAWRKRGLNLGNLGYQVLATEGFGSTGRSDISIAD